ncbi:MAG: peptidylprolyl isomerase [Phycisphaerae bacterium]|jgi:cyclophilin family peptidyl-prolyl cis-trans isomerase
MLSPKQCRCAPLFLVAGLIALHAAATYAQNVPAAQPTAESLLRAEVLAERTLLSPSQPLRVRLVLTNPTSQPIELAADSAAAPSCVQLPEALVFGAADRPALTISLDRDAPMPVRPPPAASQPASQPVGATRITLAPGTVLGREIDLREYQRSLRYSGEYRVDWSPLGDNGPRATATLRVEPRKTAILVTDYGKITFRLAYDSAPRNVENFVELARSRFYDGLTFHRIIADYIIQGGSPDGANAGMRPDGRTVPAEFGPTPFTIGTLAMARRPNAPDSASCQFFISLARCQELDGQYTVIGQASDDESLRTLQQLSALPTDANNRPTRPVVIRFLTLVDVEESAVERVGAARP